jgi:hypothetical protein
MDSGEMEAWVRYCLNWFELVWIDLMWHGFHSYTVERCVGLRSLNLSSCRWLYYLLLFSSKIINFIALHRKWHWKITTSHVTFCFDVLLSSFLHDLYFCSVFREKYRSSGIILSLKTQSSAYPNWGLIPLSRKYLRRILLPSSPITCPEVHSPHYPTYAEFCSPRPLLLIPRNSPRIPRVPTQIFTPSSPITYPEIHSPHSPSTYAEFCSPPPPLLIQRFTPRIFRAPTQSFASP